MEAELEPRGKVTKIRTFFELRKMEIRRCSNVYYSQNNVNPKAYLKLDRKPKQSLKKI